MESRTGGGAPRAARRAPRGLSLQLALACLFVLLCSLGGVGTAMAQASPCGPYNITVPHSGSNFHEVVGCSEFWIGLGPGVTPPTHGSVVVGDGVSTHRVRYTHGGNAATSDTFTILDEDDRFITFNVTIEPPLSSIVVSPATVPDGVVAAAYSQIFSASDGTAPYTFRLVGSAPPGLSFNAGTATLSGTPAHDGSFSFSIEAEDSLGQVGTRAYTLTVPPPILSISPATLPNPVRTVPYSQALSTVGGGTPPHTYRVTLGSLPPGLSLSAAGVVSGTPTTNGTYNFTIESDDSTVGGFGPYPAARAFSVTVADPPPIDVQPPTLPAGQAGVAYSQTLTAAGGTAPYTFMVSSGALPAGLSLAANGAITGSPTAVGSFAFTVTGTDDNTVTGDRAYTLDISAPTLAVGPASLPNGVGGQPYDQSLAGSGGTAPYSFSLVSGSLPPGLSLQGDGRVQGTPSQTGSFAFRVAMGDATTGTGSPFTVEADISLQVDAPTIALSPATLPAGTVDVPYSESIAASGGAAPYTYVLVAGSLPPGLMLAANGTLSGTPSLPGDYSFDVTATDAFGFTGTQSHQLSVVADVSVGPAVLPSALYGTAYAESVTASGGRPPYTFALVGGSLPVGLTLAANGSITGVPASVGSFLPEIQATDADGVQGTAVLSLDVQAPTLSLAPASLPAGVYGTAYAQQVQGSGGVPPLALSLAGTLPPGLSFNPGSGELSGTPTAVGSFDFSVTVTDSTPGMPQTVSVDYTVQVTAPPLVLGPPSLPDAVVGSPYAQQVQASGGIPPLALSLAGTLPPGLSFDTGSGAITGTPTAGGSYSFSVTATDSTPGTAQTATVSYTIEATVEPLTLGPPSLPAAVYGQPYSQQIVAAGGVPPLSLSRGGILPPGVTLNTATGELAGTPVLIGTFGFLITVTDSTPGTPQTVTIAYSVPVQPPPLTVAPASMPSGVLGSPYAQQVQPGGGIAPYSMSLAGSLPPGLSFDPATGDIAGTPTAVGSFDFSVTVVDSTPGTPQSVTVNYTVQVVAPTIALAPTTVPAATVGEAYTVAITATGGTAPYSFSLTGGGLPDGLSLSANGTLSGTPSEAGNFSPEVTATDALGATGSATLALSVQAPALAITPASLPAATQGGTYSQTVQVSGGTAPYSLSLAGTLPTGIDFDAATGVFSGTPTTTGSFALTLTATDSSTGAGAPFTAQASYTLEVIAAPLDIVTTALTEARVGEAYAATLEASGGTAPYAFTASGLPPGLVLAAGGAVSGTPTTAGAFSVEVSVGDANGASASTTLELRVLPAPLQLTPDTLPQGRRGAAYHLELSASGGTAPYTFALQDGALPPGLQLSADGTLGGTPSAAGSFSFGLLLSDSSSVGGVQTLSRSYTLEIEQAELPVAQPIEVEMRAGTTLRVPLDAGATGGPFVAANLVDVPPAAVGRTDLEQFELVFRPADDFVGTTTVDYTLSNANGTSEPARVTIHVIARADPTRDPEVTGLLHAQSATARRFAGAQLSNFGQRLQRLRSGGQAGNAFGLGLGSPSSAAHAAKRRDCQGAAPPMFGREAETCARERRATEEHAQARASPANDESARWAWWTAGHINFGERDHRAEIAGFEFDTDGVTVGADYRFTPELTAGLGLGYGRDRTDIGEQGSRSRTDGWSLGAYASWRPWTSGYMEAVLGYAQLDYELRRKLAGDGFADGDRDARQGFGSLALGWERRAGEGLFNPYLRLDWARTRLDAYLERSGDPTEALRHEAQTVRMLTSAVGMRADREWRMHWGALTPNLRMEWRRDLHGASTATMSYADWIGGPSYRLRIEDADRSHLMFGIGIDARLSDGLDLGFGYQTRQGTGNDEDHSFLLRLGKRF